jgi:hypothetical protein
VRLGSVDGLVLNSKLFMGTDFLLTTSIINSDTGKILLESATVGTKCSNGTD